MGVSVAGFSLFPLHFFTLLGTLGRRITQDVRCIFNCFNLFLRNSICVVWTVGLNIWGCLLASTSYLANIDQEAFRTKVEWCNPILFDYFICFIQPLQLFHHFLVLNKFIFFYLYWLLVWDFKLFAIFIWVHCIVVVTALGLWNLFSYAFLPSLLHG